ncbi:MAG TPA: hypothetical protein VFD92_04655 [Candidatus Binatia bacterium]|nr:hypothetical protein [Candidatus Binatia bacterium]
MSIDARAVDLPLDCRRGPMIFGDVGCGKLVWRRAKRQWELRGCDSLEAVAREGACPAGTTPRVVCETVVTPTPIPTRTPVPTPSATPTCVPGKVRNPDCGVFGYPGSCDCMQRSSGVDKWSVLAFMGLGSFRNVGHPKPTPVPTPTPLPRGPAAFAGIWWPAPEQAGLIPAAFGHPYNPDLVYAEHEWPYAVPDRASNDEVHTAVEGMKARGQMPRFFVGEPAPQFWFRWNPAGDPLGGTPGAAERVANLLAWGVEPGNAIMVAPYIFGCTHEMPRDEQDAMLARLGLTRPPGYEFRPIGAPLVAADGQCLPDYPDAFEVKVAARIFEVWLEALMQSHPEVGLVVVQMSNGSNAFSYDGHGYAIARRITRILRKHGFPPALQIEDRSCQASGARTFWEAPPSADCRMLRAVRVAGAQWSVFWGFSFGPNPGDELVEACP